MKLVIYAPRGRQFSGLSSWLREMVRELKVLGHDIEVVVPGKEIPQAKDVDFVLFFSKPSQFDSLMHDPEDVVLVTTWDGVNVPDPQVEDLKAFRKVVVPSKFSVKALQAAGIDAAVVPMGIDLTRFWPDRAPHARVRFFYQGEWLPRAGIHELIQSFVKEFKDEKDPPELWIKSWSPWVSPEDFEEVLGYLNKEAKLPLFLISSFYDDEKMRDVYTNMDVFVSASHGEAFGLTALECMACGLPPVVPAGMGMDDFVDIGVGWRYPTVSASEATPFKDDVPPGMKWQDPDFEALQRSLRYVMDNQKEVRKKCRASVERAKDFTSAKAAQRLLGVLGGL